MNIPANLRYTADHEWALQDGEYLVIGITDFAQGELGDIVYVSIPNLDKQLSANDSFGEVEAVKAVSELFMPVSGTIVAVNELLEQSPDLVNNDPYGEGWMIRVKPDNPADFEALLDAAAYKELVG